MDILKVHVKITSDVVGFYIKHEFLLQNQLIYLVIKLLQHFNSKALSDKPPKRLLVMKASSNRLISGKH